MADKNIADFVESVEASIDPNNYTDANSSELFKLMFSVYKNLVVEAEVAPEYKNLVRRVLSFVKDNDGGKVLNRTKSIFYDQYVHLKNACDKK